IVLIVRPQRRCSESWRAILAAPPGPRPGTSEGDPPATAGAHSRVRWLEEARRGGPPTNRRRAGARVHGARCLTETRTPDWAAATQKSSVARDGASPVEQRPRQTR